MGAPAADPAMDPMAADVDMGDPMAAEEEGEAEEVAENEGDIPYAATNGLSDFDGKNLSGMPTDGEQVEVSIDLGALQEALQELQDGEDVEINIGEATDAGSFAGEEAEEDEGNDDSAAALAGSAAAEEADSDAMKNAGLEEDNKPDANEDVQEENLDSLVAAIAEKLTVDLGAELSGWAGRPTSQLKHEQEREIAGAQSDDVKEDLKDLNKAQEELVAENNQLKEQNNQYKQAIQELREGMQDVNLSNARLLYTNRVLRNTSLNERQKTKIVEAISNAGSVTEAKTMYETLQSTMETTPKRGPQSLSEAISRNRTSVIRATRHESTASDPFQDRMKKLAGIK
jgi:FtsZ-binding cell division protein ZapB